MTVHIKEIKMKIIPCIHLDDEHDDTETRFGTAIEVGQIPQIGETIKLKINLFDHIFSNVHHEYKNKIIFHNGEIDGVVVNVVHSFRTFTQPSRKMFPGNNKVELCSAIDSETNTEIRQNVFVVIDFNKP